MGGKAKPHFLWDNPALKAFKNPVNIPSKWLEANSLHNWIRTKEQHNERDVKRRDSDRKNLAAFFPGWAPLQQNWQSESHCRLRTLWMFNVSQGFKRLKRLQVIHSSIFYDWDSYIASEASRIETLGKWMENRQASRDPFSTQTW